MKIDYKRELKQLYRSSSRKVQIVDVPPLNFLMCDGKGDPNVSQDFQDAIEALYGLSYTIKFLYKKGDSAVDYTVMPLEGLWWSDDPSGFDIERKDTWCWTLMIMQPELVTADSVARSRETLAQRKNPVALPRIRFETYHEGLAAQIMHIGPFSEEGPTIEKLHQYIEQNGYRRRGKHHEIYLSDIRRASPEKWKTVLRQPII